MSADHTPRRACFTKSDAGGEFPSRTDSERVSLEPMADAGSTSPAQRFLDAPDVPFLRPQRAQALRHQYQK
jgi:hypothetical protein